MLEIDNVTKTFGGRTALSEVTFDVGRGRLTGFVGGNGAGKTTTMRIILGVLSADSGAVRLGGDPLGPADRRRFGYMPEERGLYAKMKVTEQLVYLARLHGVGAKQATTDTKDLIERLGLGERANDTVESLSLGNQQRAQIAAALVHRPEVLILDEPFSGLDPMAVDTVLGVLSDAARQGTPVLFSSHQLDVVERLCDDIVVIAGGTVRASGSRERLQNENAGNSYELLVADDVGWIRELPDVRIVAFDAGYVHFEADDPRIAQAVLRRATERGTVVSFSPRRPSLTEIFTEVVR